MDEFLRHPFATHDDLIDAVARIYDIDPQIPEIYEAYHADELPEEVYDPLPLMRAVAIQSILTVEAAAIKREWSCHSCGSSIVSRERFAVP